jgi:hypothetical protein
MKIDLDHPEKYCTVLQETAGPTGKVMLTIFNEECEVLDRYGINETKWLSMIFKKEAIGHYCQTLNKLYKHKLYYPHFLIHPHINAHVWMMENAARIASNDVTRTDQ